MKFKTALQYGLTFVVVSMLCGFVYVEIQQSYRHGANDPQIQLAEDAAAGLANGMQPDLGMGKIEMATSLAPFLMIFDGNGQLTGSNAVLDGRAPSLPHGIFEWAARNGEDRITWQPRAGVRNALIVVPVKGGSGGFVATGRSLREVERRVAMATQGALIAWIVLLGICCAGIFLLNHVHRTAVAASRT